MKHAMIILSIISVIWTIISLVFFDEPEKPAQMPDIGQIQQSLDDYENEQMSELAKGD